MALCVAATCSALPLSYYSDNSVLSEGRWVKVRVDSAGVYRISRQQLSEWGFAKPENVSVYGYGAIVAAKHSFTESYPDDLVEAPFIHTGKGEVIFYADGDHRAETNDGQNMTSSRNHYDLHSYYFLTERKGGLEYKEYTNTAQPCGWHYAVGYIEREIQNPLQGGVYFHGARLGAGDSEDFTFDVADMEPGTMATIRYSMVSGNNTKSTPLLSLSPAEAVEMAPKGESIGGTSSSLYYSVSVGMAKFRKPENSDKVTFTIGIPEDFDGYYAAVDYVCAMFMEHNRLPQTGSRVMTFPKNTVKIGISDWTEGAEVWDVSDEESPARLRADSDGHVNLAPGRQNRIVVFRPDAALPSPSFVCEVPNQNLHALATPELVIITLSRFRKQAEELAAIHRAAQGIDVAVVTQEEVLNEFSSGSLHPSSLRRFVKMLYDRDPSKLRHLLLYGPATWDSRGISLDQPEMLLSHEAEVLRDAASNYVYYCSDQYFGMLADGYSAQSIHRTPMDINVGRIPALSPEAASAANRKIAKTLYALPDLTYYLSAVMLSDRGNGYAHLAHNDLLCEELKNGLPDINISRADLSVEGLQGELAVYGKKRIAAALAEGRGFMSYCGHGSPRMVTYYHLWDMSAIRNTKMERYPFVLLATCETFFIDVAGEDMGKSMVTEENGGAIGIIASGRPVYLEKNKTMSYAIAREYTALRRGDTYGDIMRRARNAFIAAGISQTDGANFLCYNYGGDPAVPAFPPDGKVSDITLNGLVPGDGPVELPPLGPVRLKAKVVDEGSDKAFSGRAEIRIYYPEYNRTTVPIEVKEDTKELPVACEDRLYFRTSAEVKDGILDCTLTLPDPAVPDGDYRVFIGATDPSTERTAVGMTKGFTVRGVDDNSPSQPLPTILLRAYIGNENFVNGDVVGSDDLFCLVVENGGQPDLSTEPASGLKVVIDGKESLADASCAFEDDGDVVFRLPLDGLSNGAHSMHYSLRSVSGEIFGGELDFIVSTGGLTADLRLAEEGTVREAAVFDAETGEYGSFAARLMVADSSGRTVYSGKDCAFPFRWDLRGTDGSYVPDGRYKAWLMLESDIAVGASNAVEFVVLRQ